MKTNRITLYFAFGFGIIISLVLSYKSIFNFSKNINANKNYIFKVTSSKQNIESQNELAPQQGLDLMLNLANQTGGTFQYIDPADTGTAIDVISKTGIEAGNIFMIKSLSVLENPVNFKFGINIDSKIDSINFFLNSFEGVYTLNLIDQNGTGVDLSSFDTKIEGTDQAKLITIKNLTPGSYFIHIYGETKGSAILKVTGESTLNLTADLLMQNDGKHNLSVFAPDDSKINKMEILDSKGLLLKDLNSIKLDKSVYTSVFESNELPLSTTYYLKISGTLINSNEDFDRLIELKL